MCGIIGYIGNQNAQKIIINSLKRLEYRGYDSVGLATFEGNEINSLKSAGKVAELESNIDKNLFNGYKGYNWMG